MLDISRTPAATLARARRIALGNGLRYVYTGNVHDPAGGDDVLPGVHRPCGPPGGHVPAGQSGALHALRHTASRRVCRSGRPVGQAAASGPRRTGALMYQTRPAAVAGSFYPSDPGSWPTRSTRSCRRWRTRVRRTACSPWWCPRPATRTQPPVAASAYARLTGLHETIRRVAVLGPAHFLEQSQADGQVDEDTTRQDSTSARAARSCDMLRLWHLTCPSGFSRLASGEPSRS